MKLHRVRLKNLNSLYGEHTVDLDRELEGAPLFLIVGPTGAGKSTIMDAVALALFAETPRLHGRTGDDPRLVMSRGTGECLAEVVFSKQKPGRKRRFYKAVWQCHRARSKADGRLQTPRRSLYELSDLGMELETLADDTVAKRYEAAFSKVLEGLSPDEFQRSMLLAQGQFSAFLRASVEERAAILERLTSTERYRDIGARAFRRWQEAARSVEAARARVDAVDLLGPEALEALRAQSAGLKAALEAAEAAHTRAATERHWFEQRAQLGNQRADAQERFDQAHTRWLRQAPRREQLAESDRCAAAGEAWRRMQSLEQALDSKRIQVRIDSEAVQEAEAAVTAATEALAALDAEVSAAAAAVAEAAPVVEEGRALEAEIERFRAETARLAEASGRIDAAEENLQTKQRALAEVVAALAESDADAAALTAEAKARRDDESAAWAASLEVAEAAFAAGLAGPSVADALTAARADLGRGTVRACLAACDTVGEAQRDALRQIAERQEAVATADARIAALATEIETHGETVAAADTDIDALEASIAQTNDRLEAAQAHLETARLAQRFAGARHVLKDGVPCPVCGATEHPLGGSAPDGDAAAVLEAVATQEAAVSEHEHALRALRERAQSARSRSAGAAARREAAITARADAEAARATAAEAAAALAAGAALPPEVATSAEALTAARDAVARHLVALDGAASAVDAAASAREAADAAVAAQRAATEERTAARTRLAAEADTLAASLVARREEHAAASAASAALGAGLASRVGKVVELRAGSPPEASGPPEAAALGRALSAAFGGGSASELERGLHRRESEARQRAAERRAAAERTSATLEARRETLASRQAEAARLETQIGEEREALQTHLTTLELPDLDALASRVLSPNERADLAAEVDEVNHRRAVAKGNLGAVDDALRAHLASQPEGFDPTDIAMETLESAFRETAAALEQARNDRAAVAAELKQQEEDRARLAGLVAELDSAETEVALWDELRKLIGTSEGGAFQRFAQTLNLAELVDKANIRLRELAPRYALVVARDRDGNPMLEFAVKDHEHADRVRPQSTLSGGETFLVSLALALALSEYRQTEMPIETLLLDEGFGTLDAETLDIAMSALERLCAAGGTQIGVISHVEALRERIGAQVIVEKMGGGRSRLRVVT